MDHYEVRSWRCVYRYFYVTGLSHLFCARMRQEYAATGESGKLTLEQIRRATSLWLKVADLPTAARKKRYERELAKMNYYQRRDQQSRKSHTKTRLKQLRTLGLDVAQLKPSLPEDTS